MHSLMPRRRVLRNTAPLCTLMSLVLMASLSLLSSPATAGETVRLTNGDWAPYLMHEAPHGIIAEIVEEAFAESDTAVHWGFFPWARSYALAEKGLWDGSAAWACTAGRAPYFYFSAPIIPVKLAFFYRREQAFDWSSPGDLKGLKVGLSRDYHYGEIIEQAAADGLIKVEVATSDEINFRKLLAGRIDLFPIDVVVGRRLLARHFSPQDMEKLAIHPRVVYATQLHLMLSKKVPGNAERMERFNQGLASIRQRGRVDAILDDAAKDLPYPVELYQDEPAPADCEFDSRDDKA